MNRVIAQRSLWGFSIVVGLCSFFLAVYLNIGIASQRWEGIDSAHFTANQLAWTAWSMKFFHHVAVLTLQVCTAVSLIFLLVIVSLTAESQMGNLAKLFIMGANKTQISRFFIFSLLKPFSLTAILGALLGVSLSRYFVSFHLVGANSAPGFIPAFHISSLIYTVLFMLLAFLCANALTLIKFLRVNFLKISAGEHQDLSRVSRIRIIAGILCFLCTLWDFFHLHLTGNYESDDNKILMIEGLGILSVFLFLPLILKLVVPGIFKLVTMVFPVTGLVARRYFHATIRKYVSLSAPIILCLIVGGSYFYAADSTVAANKLLYYGDDIHISAVSTGISPGDAAKLNAYQGIQSLGRSAAVSPVRLDERWSEVGKSDVPQVFEVTPDTLSKIMRARVTAGNLTAVHGIDIASSRDQDKVGETLHMISPAGKNLDLHIVATLDTSFIMGEGLITDYASFPEAFTVENSPHIDEIFDFPKYDFIYSGVTPQQLATLGIPAISYHQFVNHTIDKIWQQQESQFILLFVPILAICLALVIFHSFNRNAHSQYIRKVIRILRGSRWQDLALLALELSIVFLLAIVFSVIFDVMIDGLTSKDLSTEYNINLPFIYPLHALLIILLILIVGAVIPPLMQIVKTRSVRISLK